MKTGASLLATVLLSAVGSVCAQTADQPAPVNRPVNRPRTAAPAQRQAPVTRPAAGTAQRNFPNQPRPTLGVPQARTAGVIDPRTRWMNGQTGALNQRPRVNYDAARATNSGAIADTSRNSRPRNGVWNGGSVATADAATQAQWRNRNRILNNGGVASGNIATAADWRNRAASNNGQWQNRTANYNGASWNEASRRYDRQRHDRSWWRRHYSHINRFGGGYYYWDAGWWYPAWGYDSAYSSYAYDGPIYGGNYDVSPEDTISQVQQTLQAAGYYQGDVDGQLGPMTRQALAGWQRDHGLPMTSVIDPPTLSSLGL